MAHFHRFIYVLLLIQAMAGDVNNTSNLFYALTPFNVAFRQSAPHPQGHIQPAYDANCNNVFFRPTAPITPLPPMQSVRPILSDITNNNNFGVPPQSIQKEAKGRKTISDKIDHDKKIKAILSQYFCDELARPLFGLCRDKKTNKVVYEECRRVIHKDKQLKVLKDQRNCSKS